MKSFLFFLFSLCCFSVTFSQQHQWIRGGGSYYKAPSGYNAREQVREMVTDDHGNIYILAEFMGSDSITFDSMTFPIYSSVNSVYRSRTALLSYTCEGKLRWGKIISAEGNSKFTAMTYDRAGGVYIGSSTIASSGNYYIGDTTIAFTLQSCWLLKYDTLGAQQWIRSLGKEGIESASALGNWFGQLMMRDTVVHFIKSVFGTGAEIAPGIISRRGIYDISFDRQGNLLDAKRLPIADTMLYLNIFEPSNIHEPSNTLHVSVTSEGGWGGGVLTFDSMRNLVSYDTFVTVPAYSGQRAVIFRKGDYQYVFGYFFGDKCTFKGIELEQPFIAGTSFIMKMDMGNNLIWKRVFYNTMASGQGLATCLEGVHNGRIILTGQVRGHLVSGEDTMFTRVVGTISRYLPLVILDTNGIIQTMDYWQSNNPVPSYDEGLEVACHNHSIYIAGRVTDSIWGGSFGYRSKGGPEDFLLAKYGYNCQCEPPVSDFKNDTAFSGQPTKLTYTGSTSIDSLTWEYKKEIFSRLQNPNIILEAGTHKVCVTAYNACGPTRRCRELTVQCPKPTARYDFDITDNTLKMTYMGSQPVDSLRWFWGDGAQSSGHTAQHTYTRSGSYEVCLIAYLDCGSDTLCQQFHMECDAPVALFSQEKEGRTLKLHYTSATAPDSLLWSFGDGVQSQDNPATHTYDTTGWYEVCLRVWDGCGADSSCTSVYITDASAITSIEKEDLQLYPNPVTDKLYIHHNHPGAQLTIYDSRGRLCHSEVLMHNISVIHLQRLPAGMYALRYISPEGGVVYKKIVRQQDHN